MTADDLVDKTKTAWSGTMQNPVPLDLNLPLRTTRAAERAGQERRPSRPETEADTFTRSSR